MTKREERFLKAFENCVDKGEYTANYAITLLEDDRRYGWMSAEAKDSFYTWLDEWETRKAEEEEAANRPHISPVTPSGNEDEEEEPEEEETPTEGADSETEASGEETETEESGAGESEPETPEAGENSGGDNDGESGEVTENV